MANTKPSAVQVTYTPSGAGAVVSDVQSKLRETVSVFDFMTAAQKSDAINGTLSLDMSVAIQAAIDYVCPLVGIGGYAGKVTADPRYPLRVDTCIDMTNSRVSGTRIRDGLEVEGFTLVGNTGPGNAVVETTGSQWLRGDINITTAGATNQSTVGVLQAVSNVLPQTQNQNLKLRIFMYDNPGANGGMGTVGLWNFGAEENTYDNCYIQANVPVFSTSYKTSPNVTGTIPPSYQTLASSHSTGVNTWTGETFLVSLNQWYPALVTEDVNSLNFENLYMSNIGVGGSCVDAWRVFGAFQGGSISGTIEQFTTIRIVGKIVGAKIRFTFGGLVGAGQERIALTRGGQGQLVDSDISFQDTTEPNRPLLSATPISAGEQISCYIQNTKIKCNCDKQYLRLPENLLWNTKTGNVEIEGIHDTDKPYNYRIDANRKQTVCIPDTVCYVSGGASGAEIVRFIMPTITGSANSLGASIRVSGIATIVGATTSAMSVRYIDAIILIAVSQSGAISISGATNIATSQQDVNSAGNSITALSLIGINGTTYVQIALSPTVTGANAESVSFNGAAELVWRGNESRAPTFQTLS